VCYNFCSVHVRSPAEVEPKSRPVIFVGCAATATCAAIARRRFSLFSALRFAPPFVVCFVLGLRFYVFVFISFSSPYATLFAQYRLTWSPNALRSVVQFLGTLCAVNFDRRACATLYLKDHKSRKLRQKKKPVSLYSSTVLLVSICVFCQCFQPNSRGNRFAFLLKISWNIRKSYRKFQNCVCL